MRSPCDHGYSIVHPEPESLVEGAFSQFRDCNAFVCSNDARGNFLEFGYVKGENRSRSCYSSSQSQRPLVYWKTSVYECCVLADLIRRIGGWGLQTGRKLCTKETPGVELGNKKLRR